MPAPTNFGNQVTLLGAQPNAQQRIVEGQILTTDPTSAARNPGEWCLTLRTSQTSNTGGLREVNSAIAEVLFGSGGVMQRVVVSVWPAATLVLPGAVASVNLRWDPDLPALYTRPTSVTVQACLQRTVGKKSNARYVRWLPLTVSTGSPEFASFPVPAYARSLRIYGNPSTSLAASSDVIWFFLPNGEIRSALELKAAAVSGSEFEIGAAVTAVGATVNFPNFGGVSPFTIPFTWGLDWRIDI